MDDTTTLLVPIAAGAHRASATLADFLMTVPRIGLAVPRCSTG